MRFRMQAFLISLLLFVTFLLVLTPAEGKRGCRTNSDCMCGGVCIRKGKEPCTSADWPNCRCKKGCILADKYFRHGQIRTVYCNICSCTSSPKLGSVVPCTRMSWCNLPEDVPLYPEQPVCPRSRRIH